MLARRRTVERAGTKFLETPLLVPSFSSKGFPQVQKIIKTTEEVIEDILLVSAYDIRHKKVDPKSVEFATLVFLDSGGYEASKDSDLSETYEGDYVGDGWSQDFHAEVIQNWPDDKRAVVISYDHPDERLPIKDQVKRAANLTGGKPNLVAELLLKPETANQTRLNINNVVSCIDDFSPFEIIGVTEKELGNSIMARVKNIAKIRAALKKAGLETPIHIFGSLDTLATQLYYVAGADIFDGLTWLRYGYYKGQTIYKHNWGAFETGLSTVTDLVDGRCWFSNYYYLKELQEQMCRYLKNGDFKKFAYHQDLTRDAYESAIAEVEAQS